MREEALLFGNTTSLVGIITDPSEELRGNNFPAMILLNAGLLHRVGPNRLYVKIARHLAAMGFVAFRFDFSGIGDSKVREDKLPFEKSSVTEVQEAMNCLSAARGIERFILIGLCSGAAISFQTACRDPRVVGAILINFWDYHGEQLSSYITNCSAARYYCRGALFNSKSWLRLVQGRTNYRTIIRMISFQLRALFAPKTKMFSQVNHIASDFRLLTERNVHLLLVYTEWDQGLDYLRIIVGDEIYELSAHGKLRIEIIQEADHTFSPLRSQEDLLKIVHNWAYKLVQD